MGAKLYSGFQNIVFTAPRIMSQEASRFHFEHCVRLQDRSPPNQVFNQIICNYLYWYQLKSDSKKTELSFTTRCTSDNTFEVFEFVPTTFCFAAILHDTQHSAKGQQNISRNFVAVYNICCHYAYNNTLFWCILTKKNYVLYTSFIFPSF